MTTRISAAPVTQPCQLAQRETTGPGDITQPIRDLAAQGLKVRDISSLLGVHPLMVLRILNESAQRSR